MISAEEFLDVLEQKDVVAPEVLGQLRQVVARIDRPLSASWVAKWLVDNGHIAHRLAQWLLEESSRTPEPADFQHIRFPWQRRPGEDLPGELLLGMLVREDLLSEADIRALGTQLAQGAVGISAAELAEQLVAEGVLPRKMVDYLLARLVERFSQQPIRRPTAAQHSPATQVADRAPSHLAAEPEVRRPSAPQQADDPTALRLVQLLRAKDVLPGDVLDRIESQCQDRSNAFSARELAGELVGRRLLPRQLANYLLQQLGCTEPAVANSGHQPALPQTATGTPPNAGRSGPGKVDSAEPRLSPAAQMLAELLEQKGLVDRETIVQLADRADRSSEPLSAQGLGDLLVAEGLLTGKLLQHLLQRTASRQPKPTP